MTILSLNVVFYTKLFSALECGKKKAESDLVAELFDHFGAPKNCGDPVEWFSTTHSPESVFVWLANNTQSFAMMLNQIYSWLSELHSDVGGNIAHLDFDFEALNQKVPFSLAAFPKTHLRSWIDGKGQARAFNPQARGRLRDDAPNHWRNDVGALRNLASQPALVSERFDRMPMPNKRFIVGCVKHVVEVLSRHYTREAVPAGLTNWQFMNCRTWFVRDIQDWRRALKLAGEPGADRGIAVDPVARELQELFRSGLESGDLVRGDAFEELLARSVAERLSDEGGGRDDLIIDADEERDDTYAFLCAYDLCFSTRDVSTQDCISAIDRVFLPFWKHRWRLFEIWSILWTLDAVPARYRPVPRLTRRVDMDGAYTWNVPGGNAQSPVAERVFDSRTLSVWFQLRTELGPEAARTFGQNFIEPDIRIRCIAPGQTMDLVMLELKDRHHAQGSAEKRVARMYATAQPAVVCVANYSMFSARDLRDRVYYECSGGTHIYLVDDFKPGRAPTEVTDAIMRAVGRFERYDFLVDRSRSVKQNDTSSAVEALSRAQFTSARWFAWSDKCEEVSDHSAVTRWPGGGGGTNLPVAVSLHQERSRGRAIILTDNAGTQQFKTMVAIQGLDPNPYFCVDVTLPLPVEELRTWRENPASVQVAPPLKTLDENEKKAGVFTMPCDPRRLPRLALVAFAARCVRRVEPLFKEDWPDAPEEHLVALGARLALAEQVASTGARPDAYVPHNQFSAIAVEAAMRNRKLACCVAEAGTHCGRLALRVADGIASPEEAILVMARVLQADHSTSALMLRDFELLRVAIDSLAWHDNTCVPTEFFGPLWSLEDGR